MIRLDQKDTLKVQIKSGREWTHGDLPESDPNYVLKQLVDNVIVDLNQVDLDESAYNFAFDKCKQYMINVRDFLPVQHVYVVEGAIKDSNNSNPLSSFLSMFSSSSTHSLDDLLAGDGSCRKIGVEFNNSP